MKGVWLEEKVWIGPVEDNFFRLREIDGKLICGRPSQDIIEFALKAVVSTFWNCKSGIIGELYKEIDRIQWLEVGQHDREEAGP